MVQGMSVSTLTTSGNSSICGSTHSWRRNFRLREKTQITSGLERLCLWHEGAQCLSFISHYGTSRQRNLRVEAGWLFKGGDQGTDASSEHSESANEDILIFFFQLDLATQVQCALNLEQYEIAQQLRNKLTEVEAEIIRQQEAKRGSASKSEAQDKAISILRLRADLQNAVQNENYALAAELRDEISKLEAESLAASAKAQLYENAQYAFRLGQKVRHKIFGPGRVNTNQTVCERVEQPLHVNDLRLGLYPFHLSQNPSLAGPTPGYRAVVCGMDLVCCESSSWKEIAQVEKLSRGAHQPFYQVLVDVHVDPNLLVAYVPEENLLAPDQPDMGRFDHPYTSFLFYGMDAAGDFIPIKQMREKYNRPRHELPYDPQDEKNGEDA